MSQIWSYFGHIFGETYFSLLHGQGMGLSPLARMEKVGVMDKINGFLADMLSNGQN